MTKLIIIKEYDYLVAENAKPSLQGKRISVQAFDELTNLINNSPEQADNDHGSLFWQRGQRLQARHYVGFVRTCDGTQIEILPKIAELTDETKLRGILLKMLRRVGELPIKNGQSANLGIDQFPLLEVFIQDFLQSVDDLVKRGIRSDYVRLEDNLAYLKGKLLVANQIKHNSIRRDRFYVQYDSFEVDRPENRLIKSALTKVIKLSKTFKTQRLARELSFAFADVPFSTNCKQDFQNCSKDRGMHYYQTVLDWCRIILNDQSPVPKAGERSFRSFLFPMPVLFERYVAKVLQTQLTDWQVKTQVSGKQLLIDPVSDRQMFTIKPDIMLLRNNVIVIADTKWKLLNETDTKNNFGISQGDLYQLFTYASYYNSFKVVLIYPKTQAFTKAKAFKYKCKNCDLILIPYDLDSDFIEKNLFNVL